MRMEKVLKDGGSIIMSTQEMAQLQMAIQYAIKHEKAELTWIRSLLELYDDFEKIRAEIIIPDNDK